jgi:hypothetical protein
VANSSPHCYSLLLVTPHSSLVLVLVAFGMLTKPLIQLFFGWLPPEFLPKTLVKILMLRLEYFFQFGALSRFPVFLVFSTHRY